MSDVEREIALLREEVKEYTQSILSLVIGGHVGGGTLSNEGIMDYADKLVESCQRRAQQIVDRRHG